MNSPSAPRVPSSLTWHPNFTASPALQVIWNSTQNVSVRVQLLSVSTTTSGPQAAAWVPFPTVDVPDHAHYTLGSVILLVGLTGMLGNLTVIYTFCSMELRGFLITGLSPVCALIGDKSWLCNLLSCNGNQALLNRGLRTPANMFIINLAVSDFLMSFTQAPVFFASSLYKKWLFGETAIAMDRYLVITRPLATIGMGSKRRTAFVLLGVWLYALAWSLPPFFGWSSYVPEGLLTSCSWDYMTFTPRVRAYTMLLFCFVFFLPLLIIIFCYIFIFRAIRETGRACEGCGKSPLRRRQWQRLQSEWKMAKVALIVILLFVLSWAPYATVALVAFAGYSHNLTPYMSSVPAVIAKASAIHNPIIYAITHPKYRVAIAQHLPCLGVLLRVSGQRRHPSFSYHSTHRSTLSSHSSDLSWISGRKRQESLGSESEVGWTDTETTAAWGAAQQARRQSFYSQDLEDGVVKAPSTPQTKGYLPSLDLRM
ncbi:melanopsin isoform X2 [Arvicanthis niloticus]|uniref:melanopsin isoform X2 n=1 Tax=Arvicanthis niloticus TaxID=61156 RepID=UPI00402B8809